MLTGLTLSPATATILFILAVVAGYQYRRVWKNEGPVWQKWVYGLIAAMFLLTLGFLPLETA